MKEPVKTGFEKYLEEFDEKYRKKYHDKQKVIPILLNVFEQYEEDIYTLSTLDKEVHKLQKEITNKLQNDCNDKQNELINQLKNCIYSETGELVEKAFVYGYCVGKSVKEESEIFTNNNNKNCNS